MGNVTSRRARGFNTERKLVKLLSGKNGNYVFRIPVSGGRGLLPDVFLVNNKEGKIVAFEVKSTVNDRVKIKKRQISKLFYFLESFKKYPKREAVIAIWFVRKSKWVFKKINDFPLNDIIVKSEDSNTWEP